MEKLIINLYEAYKYFNRYLFYSLLPDEISINMYERVGRAMNAFVPNAYESKTQKGMMIDEYILNPFKIDGKSPKGVLSLLAHDMCHAYVHHRTGLKQARGYHTTEWAKNMKLIDLYPSSTGLPGGDQIGFKMSHYIVNDGKFDQVATNFIEEFNFSIDWTAVYERKKQRKKNNKVRYICDCDKSIPLWVDGHRLNVTCNICKSPYKVS